MCRRGRLGRAGGGVCCVGRGVRALRSGGGGGFAGRDGSVCHRCAVRHAGSDDLIVSLPLRQEAAVL